MRGFRRNPALVDTWFDLMPDTQRETAQALHAAIMAAAPRAELEVRSGNLYYGVGHEHALALAPHRTHVHLQVLVGAEPSAAFPELVRNGKGLMWRFRLGEPIDAASVKRLAAIVLGLLQATMASDPPRF